LHSTHGKKFFHMSAHTELTYYGQSAFKLVTPNDKIIFIDPWLQNPLLKNGKEILAKIDRADLICITHGHTDHVGDAVEIAKRTKAKLVATFDLAIAMKQVLGYPADQAEGETVGHFGGELSLLDGEVTALFVPAWHGTAMLKDENSAPHYSGTPSGVVLAVRNGPTIYHTGDTDIFTDIKLVGDYYQIDYMCVCMGGHFTMGPRRAAHAVELVRPKTVIPIHFGTFPLLTGTPDQLQSEMKARGVTAQLRQLQPGETIVL
jgi:L-ascorbate metabolism protein UlaG (beta-lactamase superfamily)